MMTATRRAAAILSLATLIGGCSVLPTSDPAPVVRGPISSRPQQPMFLTNLALRPRRAQTQAAGTWAGEFELAHSSLFELRTVGQTRVSLDGEISRASVRTRYGLDERTDVELELAAVYGSSGFLDRFIDEFHNLLLLPDGGRSDAVDDQYEMSLSHNGVTAYSFEEDHIVFGDAPLVVTHRVRTGAAGDPTIALRAGVDLPLGSEDLGTGNGALDWGVGVLGEHLVGRWSFFWGADLLAGQESEAFEQAQIEVLDQVHAHAGAEVRWTDHMSVLLQLSWTGPITESIDFQELDREIFDLGIGCAWDLPRGARLRFSFHEDLVAQTGTDLSVLFGIGWGF